MGLRYFFFASVPFSRSILSPQFILSFLLSYHLLYYLLYSRPYFTFSIFCGTFSRVSFPLLYPSFSCSILTVLIYFTLLLFHYRFILILILHCTPLVPYPLPIFLSLPHPYPNSSYEIYYPFLILLPLFLFTS